MGLYPVTHLHGSTDGSAGAAYIRLVGKDIITHFGDGERTVALSSAVRAGNPHLVVGIQLMAAQGNGDGGQHSREIDRQRDSRHRP